jgi:hypothetical protein
MRPADAGSGRSLVAESTWKPRLVTATNCGRKRRPGSRPAVSGGSIPWNWYAWHRTNRPSATKATRGKKRSADGLMIARVFRSARCSKGACRNRRDCGISPTRTAPPAVCASWVGSAIGSGRVPDWNGDIEGGRISCSRCSQSCSQIPANAFIVFPLFSVPDARAISAIFCMPFRSLGTPRNR